MALLKGNLSFQNSEGRSAPVPEPKETRASRVESIIRQRALASIWGLESQVAVDEALLDLATAIAKACGKDILDFSGDDVARAAAQVMPSLIAINFHKIRIGRAIRLGKLVHSATPFISALGCVYRAASLALNNPGPLMSRLGVKFGGIPLLRAAGMYACGLVLANLYIGEGEGSLDPCTQEAESTFDPIFDSLTLHQLQELTSFLGIDARISWPSEKLRDEILSYVKGSCHDLVSGLWRSKPTSYIDLVKAVANDIEVPNSNATADVVSLEERIVMRMFADSKESVAQRGWNQIAAVMKSYEPSLLGESWGSLSRLGALTVGKLGGFQTYVAGSVALSALSKGMGLGLGFSAYTSMSSALATILGPIGLGTAALGVAYDFAKPRPKKAIPFVLYLAVMRAKIEVESKRRIPIWTRLMRGVKKVLYVVR